MLYIYHLDALTPAAQMAFVEAADRCGEGVCRIEAQDLQKTVAECLDTLQPMALRNFTPLAQVEAEPFLLMAVDDLAIDTLLAALREREVRIGHKCMVTDKNRAWTVAKLIGDVAEEHALMTVLVKLQQMVQAAEAFQEADYDALLWLNFVRERDKVQDLLAHVGKVDIPVQAAEAAFASFNEAVTMMLDAKGVR